MKKIVEYCFILLFFYPMLCNANCDSLSEKSGINELFSCIDNLNRKLIDLENQNKGMVSFFNLTNCPKGWKSIPATEGRYIVASLKNGKLGETVGVALNDQENRAVGKHSHKISPAGKHSHNIGNSGEHDHTVEFRIPSGNGKGVSWGGGADLNHVKKQSTKNGKHSHPASVVAEHDHAISDTGEVSGTNAPYIQYLACEKE